MLIPPVRKYFPALFRLFFAAPDRKYFFELFSLRLSEKKFFLCKGALYTREHSLQGRLHSLSPDTRPIENTFPRCLACVSARKSFFYAMAHSV
jgi:hypothetical protein